MLSKLLLTILLSLPLFADWNEYKDRFIQHDGRVLDKKNGNITHSETIGYTLYFAYRFNDDKTFDKVYHWYKNNLKKNQYGLVSWKWGKKDQHTWGILDHNNATDGDMWIAYDLLLMGQKRVDERLKSEAISLMEAIKKHLVITYGKKRFLLPGKEGFIKQGHIVLNPSYYRFDILEAFSAVDDKGPWKIRVFDNKFPAVSQNGNPVLRTDNRFYTYAAAVGKHEVVVETPVF
jgi:endoglucanase